MSIIKTENLTYIYGMGTPFEKIAIKDINLEIEQGEFVGIIGHTGSGKSTLIQHFNGLLKPTKGNIYVDGKNIWDKNRFDKSVRFNVGLVLQYPEHQIFEETVYKDIAFGPKNMNLSKDDIDVRVIETALSVGITEDMLKMSPFELSGGQKRRVAIAGVMAMQPKVLILDEPTAGLDPRGREKILSMIKNYHKSTDATILLVSHSMEDVANYTKKIIVMNDAKLFCHDDLEKVFSKSNEISEMGLGVPQITTIFNELKKKGFDFSSEVYTVDFAVNLILSYLKDKKGGHKC